MIYIGTNVNISDNSGAKLGKCLKIVGGKKIGSIGDIILVTLKKILHRKKVKKRTTYIGLLIGIKYWIKRFDGIYIKIFSNKILLFNKQFKFLGTRIYGLLLKEVKISNWKEKKYRNYFHKVINYTSFMI